MTIATEQECLDAWGTGPTFEVVLHDDVVTSHGNVVAAAGTYNARQSSHGQEGDVTIWSPSHYTGRGMSVGIALKDWAFPGEAQRPMPEHDCIDNARSGVVDGIYCGVCMAVLA